MIHLAKADTWMADSARDLHPWGPDTHVASTILLLYLHPYDGQTFFVCVRLSWAIS
jgi:hypothetical protein